ncbi:serine hydrolase [Deinococcus wulumuqiensis]|uniref:Serine hydrolase n=1 Tax=Deinococcus wulumuqiensis TaxID=980427 RepID=A0A345IED2_9DEIO|nr:serine hydrolase [Deinococcus wulumuqiensis]AXG98054.1 serine hydrolase [Deinococcus wulumuqiensis]
MRGTIRLTLALLLLGGAINACRSRESQDPAPSPQAVDRTANSSHVRAGVPTKPARPATPAPASDVPATAPDVPPTPSGCLPPAPAVAPAPPPPQALSGRLGLWVAEVDPRTLEPRRAVASNPDDVFPLASTYKQAVLWALLREFDAGRVSPNERFDVTVQNQSLGDYPYDDSNVRELSQRMIQFSDNTATDILHRRAGLRQVQDVADRLHLCRTRLILPTKAWWVAETGLSPAFNGARDWGTATGTRRLQLARQIDADAQKQRYDQLQRQLDDYFDHRYDPADDLKVHNVSTPYEFATLVTHEFLRPGLSPRAQKWQREVMATGFGRSALKAQHAGNIDYFGGKGGNGWKLLTYSGYFQTRDGRRVVYAFMQHGADETYTMPNTRRAFAWINAAVDEVLGKQRPQGAPTSPLPTATPAERAKADAVEGAQQRP